MEIDGVPILAADGPVRDSFHGDVGGLSSSEIHYYLIPDALRPLRVRASVAELPLALADRTGRIIRQGRGFVDVAPQDPPNLILAAMVEGALDRVVAVELRVERGAAQQQVAVNSPSVTNVPPPQGNQALPSPFVNPNVTVVPPPIQGQATIRGSIIEAGTGRAVPGAMLLVGRPGVDLIRHVSDYVARRITEEQFFALLVGYGRTDATGRYEVTGLVPRTAYPAASFANGYQPVNLRISVGIEGSVIELNPIPIRR
jgi:hypothetical protein